MDVESEECERRATNRKVDPQTNTVYHMEDNPPPENDNKLKDRLVDFVDPLAEPERMQKNMEIFEEQKEAIKNWFSMFGEQDEHLATLPCLVDFK